MMTMVNLLSLKFLTKLVKREPVNGQLLPHLRLALLVGHINTIAFLPVLQRTLVTLIGEAVFARCLSAIKDERVRASKIIAGPQREPFRGDKKLFIDDLEQALYASKIISYTQGFMLMRETAKEVRNIELAVYTDN